MKEILTKFKSVEKGGILLLALFFLFYLRVSSPTLVPYRDAGEMVCDAYTLSIAHQPGYPLYVLLSALFSKLVFFGNPAYKLNLFSALCGALSLFAFYRFLRRRVPAASAFACAALLGVNFTFATVSTVSEMYSLNILFILILFLLAAKIGEDYDFRLALLFAYLTGLFMGNRIDIVLVVPAAFILFFGRFAGDLKSHAAFKKIFLLAAFALAGFSIYLYLPIRSLSDPLIDWSNPETLSNFLWVVMRKSYGSTLDLVSKNYAMGEMFLPNLKHYWFHLADNFGPALLLVPFGLAAGWKTDRKLFFSFLVLFLVTGPFYLFLANMPPNPHALAVVEPNYFAADIPLVAWMGMSCGFFSAFPKARFFPLLLLVGAVFWQLRSDFWRIDRRELFAARDFARDAFRSLGENSVLVAKKDVQLFSLWHASIVEGVRPDVKVVAQGLSGSPWYQDSFRAAHPGTPVENLSSGGAGAWKNMAEIRPLAATVDANIPRDVPVVPRGLVGEVYPRKKISRLPDYWRLFNLEWVGQKHRDFFCEDIAKSYENALVNLAAYESGNGGISKETFEKLNLFSLMHENAAQAELYAGFYYSSRGNWEEASDYFSRSAQSYENLLALARRYRALDDVVDSISDSASYSWLNYGVSMEKKGMAAEAEEAYLKALERNPRLAQAHYNMAILYWKKDPGRAVRELKKTLKLNPDHEQAGFYLKQMQRK